MKNNILKIKNLKKIYHTKDREFKAVDNFSFNLEKGEFIAIVGPSGCGKSTILGILCNLEKPTSGKVEKEKDITFGYMLQNDNLFDWLTVYDNCKLALEIQNKKENIPYVEKLIKTYGLDEFKNTYPNNLSGGMRQRVSLIRTLATKPDILLLDEPLSALDYQTRLAVSEDIYKMIKKENISVIMVTHDVAEAVTMANKVIVLTGRPSKIKNIYKIELNEKSSPIQNRKDKKFNYYYEKIWKDIDYHV